MGIRQSPDLSGVRYVVVLVGLILIVGGAFAYDKAAAQILAVMGGVFVYLVALLYEAFL